jgi:tetratricopeptide (TPR) repeat protein
MNPLKILILACFVAATTSNALAQPNRGRVHHQPEQQQQSNNQTNIGADKLLALGDFYYRTNDITDAADRYYRQVIHSSPGSQAAGNAQYNRGSYWFRKYYLTKEQYSKEDRAALSEAEGQYYDFIDKFAQQTNTIGLLSDAEFNLALVYLQQGKREYAIGWLNRMLAEAVKHDQAVHIYKVVWSSKPADLVDRNVDAAQLATFARNAMQKDGDFNSVVLEIKRWCQRQ